VVAIQVRSDHGVWHRSWLLELNTADEFRVAVVEVN